MDTHRVWVRKDPEWRGTDQYITVYVDDAPVMSVDRMETLDGFAQALMAEIAQTPTE